MFPILNTERLLLREIKEEDTKNIFAIFSNDDVTRYYGQESLTGIEQAKGFVDFFDKIFREKRGIRWGIEIKGQKGIIGTIGFNAWSPKNKRAEIGYDLLPDYWGKGYATEAVTVVTSYGFNELNLKRIGAIVFIENEVSSKLLTKLGFEKEGILRNYMVQNNISHDTYVYSLIKEI